jgi:hypothetical protein
MPDLEQASELDRLALGPDAAYARPAEPPPEQQPEPPKPPPRRKGPVELATARDLKALPAVMRTGALAATALMLARELDGLDMTARDTAGHARELRMHMTQLAEMAPGGTKGDATDEVRERRERRLSAAGE